MSSHYPQNAYSGTGFHHVSRGHTILRENIQVWTTGILVYPFLWNEPVAPWVPAPVRSLTAAWSVSPVCTTLLTPTHLGLHAQGWAVMIFILWVRKWRLVVCVGHIKGCHLRHIKQCRPASGLGLNAQNVCLHCGVWHWGFTAVGKAMGLKWEVTLDELRRTLTGQAWAKHWWGPAGSGKWQAAFWRPWHVMSNTFLLCKAAEFVVNCDGTHRKLIQVLIPEVLSKESSSR